MGTRWEYMEFDLSAEWMPTSRKEQLNRLGQDGWELCAIYDGDILIFKRPA